MNRRASISTLLGKSKKQKATTKSQDRTVSGLEEYTGPWEFKQAAHLLRRTMFGPNWQQIQSVVNDGLETTVNKLLEPTTPLSPEPPINYYYENDPDVPVGETWINAPHVFGDHLTPRNKSLQGWTAKQCLEEGISVVEKMTLFWHNHFVTSDFVSWPRLKYIYITTIRENALGNFRELAKAMTIDPLMLLFLNGSTNTKVAPNENFARELLELFTIGKGPIIAPGDYSNYTELDIASIAKILTGWSVADTNIQGVWSPNSVFNPNSHDTNDKQLSYHFNNEVIIDAGEDEYINLINIIFQQNECARHICRKIYRWFIHYQIDEEIEINIIEPLAQILIDNDYEITSVLFTLFKSQHFYDDKRIGCMIKNPWDFVIGMVKQLQVNSPTDPAVYYETYRVIFQGALGLQMEYYNPPSVSGWKAYYQEPTYYRIWLTSVTLPLRDLAANILATFGLPLYMNPDNTATPFGFVPINYLEILNNLSNPWEPSIVVADFIKLLFPKGLAANQKAILENILTSTWTNEYSNYIGDPTNTDLANSIKGKIRSLVVTMLRMPEFQLM